MAGKRPLDGKAVRDWIMFGVGILGVAYETIVASVDRPALLALFAAMLGLPLFLRRDERHDEHDPSKTTPKDEGG